MGTRIHKDIGYFLSKKHISKLLVNNYDEILDDLNTIEQSTFQTVMDELISLKQSNNSPVGFTFSEIQLNSVLKNKQQKTYQHNELLKTIYDYDNFKGLLFLTPELSEYSRGDDLIDYYEHVNDTSFKLQYLKQPMYPDNYYVCIDPPILSQAAQDFYSEETPKNPVLKSGDLVLSDKLHFLLLMNGNKEKDERINPWAYPNPGQKKHFHPYINILTYCFAKAINILKPDISYIQFAQLLEPSIVTSWG